ncbi:MULTISPECIES: helix-turn-helix domain-containing protein [unclassified Thioalkalivibrio]|uniref:helix-turn-helix domain-containing protein n=1 Tax=unclassified Thioalkalivibrio TaxID=2621013 RepID=UPI0009D9EA1C
MTAPSLPPCDPESIRAAREAVGHSQAQAAALVHTDGRTWRRWEAGDRSMPLAAWELYLLKTGARPL